MSRKDYIPLASRLESAQIENRWLRDINWHLSRLVLAVGQNASIATSDHRRYGDERYPYLPFDHSVFLRTLIALRLKLHYEGYGKPYMNNTPKPRFIDVGCGIGDKLLLAHQLGCEVNGVEINPYLIRYAKRVFGVTDSEEIAKERSLPCIIRGDILRLAYDSYQIIYFDSPFQDNKTEAKLEHRIYSQAALGAFILTPHHQTLPSKKNYAEGKNFGSQNLRVFRRIHKAGRNLVVS